MRCTATSCGRSEQAGVRTMSSPVQQQDNHSPRRDVPLRPLRVMCDRRCASHRVCNRSPHGRAKEVDMLESASSYPLANAIWTMFVFFAWIVWIWLLFMVFTDLFRRP